MNILAIGNSFSEDAMRYLHDIAKADRQQLATVNLFIGGCSLERHYANMLSDEKIYELQYNGNNTGFLVSLKEAVTNREWDIVTLQQVSTKSFDQTSYMPYLAILADYVRKNIPKAKIYLHQTWAYESGSDRLLNIAKYDTSQKMLKDIVKAYDYAEQIINAEGIIRSGELFEKLLCGCLTKVHRDTFHASLGLGRYALGLLWYGTIFHKSVNDNSFCALDENVLPEEITSVKECVDSFLKCNVL